MREIEDQHQGITSAAVPVAEKVSLFMLRLLVVSKRQRRTFCLLPFFSSALGLGLRGLRMSYAFSPSA